MGFAVVWSMLVVALGMTWVKTLKNSQTLGDITAECLFALFLLFAFFLIAGLEIAYTDLRDKDPDQLDTVVQPLVAEMQKQEDVVYESREWLGVLLIFAFTYISYFDAIFIPWVGRRGGRWALLFNLLFTTFPLVLIAQGPAKYFAARNSEAFLRFTAKFTWPVFRIVGWIVRFLELRTLSRTVARLLMPIVIGKGYRRNLPPSRAAFYVSALKSYGYALHYLKETILIEADGTAVLKQTGLIHVVSGGRSSFTRSWEFDSPPDLKKVDIKVLRACNLPQPGERVADLCSQIEPFLRGDPLPKDYSIVDHSNFKTTATLDKDNPNKVVCEISSAIELPDGPLGSRAFLLEFEAQVTSNGRTFDMKEGGMESHFRLFAFPCRRYELEMSMKGRQFGKPTVPVTFQNSPHLQEDKRATAALVPSGDGTSLACRLDYPLPAAKYEVQWEMW